MTYPMILVAAIDIGTTYSGYAFSFRHEFKKDPYDITVHNWREWFSAPKTSTSILLNPQKEFECFGYDAEDRYRKLVDYDLHHDWYYFRQFKKVLHDTLVINSLKQNEFLIKCNI